MVVFCLPSLYVHFTNYLRVNGYLYDIIESLLPWRKKIKNFKLFFVESYYCGSIIKVLIKQNT